MHTYILENEICSLFIAVPLWEVQFYSEALSKVFKDVLLCVAACIRYCSQHLSNTVHVKGVIFLIFDQLFKNLVVREIN